MLSRMCHTSPRSWMIVLSCCKWDLWSRNMKWPDCIRILDRWMSLRRDRWWRCGSFHSVVGRLSLGEWIFCRTRLLRSDITGLLDYQSRSRSLRNKEAQGRCFIRLQTGIRNQHWCILLGWVWAGQQQHTTLKLWLNRCWSW